MIKINERTYVVAQHIKSLSKPEGYDYIRVTMFDGEVHTVQPEYGQTIYDKLDELVAAVRADSGIA